MNHYLVFFHHRTRDLFQRRAVALSAHRKPWRDPSSEMLPDILGYEIVNKTESVKRERSPGSLRGITGLLISRSNELAFPSFIISSTLAIPKLPQSNPSNGNSDTQPKDATNQS